MEVLTGRQMRKKHNEDFYLITEKLQEKGASLKKEFRHIEQTANRELAEPNITPETTEKINGLVATAKDSFLQGNSDIVETMQAVTD